MSDTAVGLYLIGQAPRPDLTDGLAARFGSSRLRIRGALDAVSAARIPACPPDGYPLETRLRDGSQVIVDGAFVEPHLQEAIDAQHDRVAIHLVLCAGSFPRLTARKTLLQPFEISAAELRSSAQRHLAVVVPFAAQAAAARRKWEAAGFSCRTHVLGEKPRDMPIGEWSAECLSAGAVDALVFDYVGFPPESLEEAAAAIDVPVCDLGLSAFNKLEEMLNAP